MRHYYSSQLAVQRMSTTTTLFLAHSISTRVCNAPNWVLQRVIRTTETCSSSHYKRDAFFLPFFFFPLKKIGANAYGYDEDSTVSDSCYGWTWRHLLIWRSILNLTAAASRRTGNLSLSFSFWENGQHMHSSLSTSVKPLGLWTTSLAIPSGPWLSGMHPPFTVLPFYCPGMLMHARIFVWTLYGA